MLLDPETTTPPAADALHQDSSREPVERLPDYAPALNALHRAFARELDEAIGELPLWPGSRVLDTPCGDGFYTACLARRVGRGGAVVAADHCTEYLDQAARRAPRDGNAADVQVVRADAYHLPFEAGSFDLVWCAQSLVSLDPNSALGEIQRVLRPGGLVAVMENDDFHHVLLPWSVELELAVQRACYLSCRERFGDSSKLYQSRRLSRTLRRAGLVPWWRTTHAIDREAPLGADERDFFAHFFEYLRELSSKHLELAAAREFASLTDPGSDRYLLDRPDFEATYLFTVALGKKPQRP